MSATEKKEETKSIAKSQPSHSERFTNMVVKEFSSNAGELNLTNFQKKLCQNYFIKIDSTLKDAEKKRMAKSEQYRDALALTWENVNMQKLAQDVVAFSSVGLDPMQPNHINIIPYKNTATSKYDMGFIIGYRGCELKANKYGLDVPDATIVELVFKNDKFVPLKKDSKNKIENYTFDIVNPFDRGELIGGFYYHVFNDNPEKNTLVMFSKAEIEKRKPAYASAEFWGGEKDKYESGKKVGKETVDGWYNEMCYKTLCRAAFNSITIDSEKIDAHYQYMITKERESSGASAILNLNTAKEKAMDNAETIQFTEETAPDEVPATTETTEAPQSTTGFTDAEKAEIAKEEAEEIAKQAKKG